MSPPPPTHTHTGCLVCGAVYIQHKGVWTGTTTRNVSVFLMCSDAALLLPVSC